MRRPIILPVMAGLSLLLFSVSVVKAHQGATGIIKERMDEFSKSRSQMKEIRTALSYDDFDLIAETASDMQDWASRIKASFPEGSNGKPSEALSVIWEDEAGFNQAIANYQQALMALTDAALSQDKEATITAFTNTGQACKSCHSQFRM